LKPDSTTKITRSSDADQPSHMRRNLLKACAYLPASSLLAMIGGCSDGSDDAPESNSASTFSPPPEAPPLTRSSIESAGFNLGLPPFKTTDTLPPPPVQQPLPLTGSTEVTHLPDKMPAPSGPKKVGIYSLQYNSFTQVSSRKEVPPGTEGAVTATIVVFAYPWDVTGVTKTVTYESIKTYVQRALDNRFALLYRAMVTAFAQHSPKEFDVSFVTAPEFYWNVPFGDFLDEAELQSVADLCLETVKEKVLELISKFPADKYGQIVLLPGTMAVLKLNPDARKADGTPAGNGANVFTATNRLVCTHNLPLDGKRPAYMIWPKRVVSWIDFIDEEAWANSCGTGDVLELNPLDPKLDNYLHNCLISKKAKLNVLIERVSSAKPQSFDSKGTLLSSKFNNNLIDGLPFGIDVCLDYGVASIQKDEYRYAQLDAQEFLLDFVIAAGMPLDITTYASTPFIQYAIRNEGYSGKTGETNVWKLNWTKPVGGRLGLLTYEARTPLDADSPTDVVKGVVKVDLSDKFVAPEGADAKGIPQILDPMNAGIVRIWSLDMASDEENKIAAATLSKTLASEPIQFVQ